MGGPQRAVCAAPGELGMALPASPCGLAVSTVKCKRSPLSPWGSASPRALVSWSPEAGLIPLSPASRAVPAIHSLVNASWMNLARMKKPHASKFSGKIIRNFNEH